MYTYVGSCAALEWDLKGCSNSFLFVAVVVPRLRISCIDVQTIAKCVTDSNLIGFLLVAEIIPRLAVLYVKVYPTRRGVATTQGICVLLVD